METEIILTLQVPPDIDGLVQDCSISNALALEILQSCTKPSISSDLSLTILDAVIARVR